MFDCSLFNNHMLSNLIEKTGDKFLILGKDNQKHFWSGTVNSKWYNQYDSSIHVIGGIFGGHRDKWENIVNLFEGYVENIIEEDKTIPHEENVMSLMYFNNQDSIFLNINITSRLIFKNLILFINILDRFFFYL